MKKMMSYLLCAAMITSSVTAFAQQNYGNGNANGNGYGNGYGNGNNPNGSFSCNEEKVAAQKALRESASAGKAIPISGCEKLNIVAIANKNSQLGRPQQVGTVDGKYVCISHGGYTVDFDDCVKVKNAYDQVTIAEVAMLKAQEIKINETNIKQTKAFTEAQAKGDGQNAAIDATIQRNEMNAKMYKNQARIYTTAVGYLGTMMSVWQGKRDNGIERRCKEKGVIDALKKRVPEEHGDITPGGSELCASVMKQMKDDPGVYANSNTRAAFLAALAIYLQKAAEAKRKAGLSEDVAERMKKAPLVTNDEPVNTLIKCLPGSTSIDCVQQNPRGKPGTGSFNGSSFEVGSGGGISDFNFQDGAAPNIGDDPSAGSNDPEKVTDVASPFEDQAKEASGILNPADAAQVTPGSAPAGGGAGGGGGGGGGGSSSVGDDLAGATADENKDPDITTNKFAGKYGKSGGSGFTAVAKSKDDAANPFASMFDSKGDGEGGIEEDRSIASEEGGEASGLFEKISRKYGQMQADKRVESQNVE